MRVTALSPTGAAVAPDPAAAAAAAAASAASAASEYAPIEPAAQSMSWGRLKIELVTLDPTRTMCGEILCRVQRVLTTHVFKPAWAVLTDAAVCVYDYRVDREPRDTFEIKYIDRVHFDVEDETIIVDLAGMAPMIFRVSSASERREWLRKLRRVAEHIPTNEFCPAEVAHDEYLRYKGKGSVLLYDGKPIVSQSSMDSLVSP